MEIGRKFLIWTEESENGCFHHSSYSSVISNRKHISLLNPSFINKLYKIYSWQQLRTEHSCSPAYWKVVKQYTSNFKRIVLLILAYIFLIVILPWLSELVVQMNFAYIYWSWLVSIYQPFRNRNQKGLSGQLNGLIKNHFFGFLFMTCGWSESNGTQYLFQVVKC